MRMADSAQIDLEKLDELSVEQLRELTRTLLVRTEHDSREIVWRDAKIDKLTFEIAQLKRMKFDRSSEQMSAEQRALFDEAVDGDIAAIDEQLAALQAALPPKPDDEKKQPKRKALPERLPRREVHHEPEDTTCGCGQAMQRIGEDVSEKLDYTPGVFTVERHVRGKWCCAGCRTLTQAPVPPAVIDKGIPTAGLLAHVLVAKHADHLPLYRQEAIFGRAGLVSPGVEGRAAALPGAARRRDAGGHVGARNRQDAASLPLGVRSSTQRTHQGGGLRLHTRQIGRTRKSVPRPRP